MSNNSNDLGSLTPQGLEDVSEVNLISEEEFKSFKDVKAITKTLIANWGNFRGELTFSYWWGNNGAVFYCYCSQYRITRYNGQSGGNKANLHFRFDALQSWANDSPDAMWQDGVWHSYARGGWIAANKVATVSIEFIFDKSGDDPKARASDRYYF